jgi:putative PIN family toxin of toxin-antitoxin system
VANGYVLDTGVLVAGLRSDRGSSRQLLLAAVKKEFELQVSVPLLIEYETVMTRPEHLEASRLTRAEVARVLDLLAVVAKPVHLSYRWRPFLADPNDDMVLETAINGGAAAVVTFNLRHFAEAAKTFRCRIYAPSVALQEIRSFHEKK